MKDGTYIINIDDKQSKRIKWVSLIIDRNTAICLRSIYLLKYIPQEALSKVKDQSVTQNIFRIRSDDSIMCGFYCIVFIEYMIAGKTLLDYTKIFSPNDYQNNDKMKYKYFKGKYGRRIRNT